MPQLDQVRIIVDAYLHNRECLLVIFHILERCDHVLKGLRSNLAVELDAWVNTFYSFDLL
jgi:hypothetical protein